MAAAAGSPLNKLTNAPIDRRERRPVSMHGFAALEDGTTAEILLLDLSYDGCGIEIPLELTPGQPITLSVLRRGAIHAQVRWYNEGRAGLTFCADVPAPEQQRPRISERHPLVADLVLRRLGKSNFRVRVLDLSPTGCKVELVERPSIGEHMLVKLDGLEPMEAEACWVEDYCGGLRFEKPMHPAVFELLLERLRSAP